ncbi:unnamed protein product [Prorocentrum cordatum]|uniref:Uncharacterized protein n=1 Tax=Prorocentrum cordatum TaxID=2364126 RepID=A0ABN9RV46_9DINO|nr:unnamed protein product [Polarella glacialis]
MGSSDRSARPRRPPALRGRHAGAHGVLVREARCGRAAPRGGASPRGGSRGGGEQRSKTGAAGALRRPGPGSGVAAAAMGECAARPAGPDAGGAGADGGGAGPPHERLAKAPRWCLKAADNDVGGPFQYRVEFRGPVADHEAQAIRALSELLWVGPGRPGEADAALRRCCSALEQMKVLHGDKLQDYVVPVANMVLHAPCRAVRTSLWSRFVLAQAQEDWTLGHLFYWAFRCVADSPDAEGGVREDAEAKCAEVACLLRAKALSLGLQVLLESANDAARLGRTQPRAVAMDPDQVTPLIDLLTG